jgi:hypothetical protein
MNRTRSVLDKREIGFWRTCRFPLQKRKSDEQKKRKPLDYYKRRINNAILFEKMISKPRRQEKSPTGGFQLPRLSAIDRVFVRIVLTVLN